MKKIISGLTMIVIIMLSSSVNAQSYTELGRNSRDVESIIKILVLDDENSKPISGAVVKLFDGSRRMFEIKTDRNGIAVIIVRHWLYDVDRDGDMLKVRDKDYRYNSWEGEFDLVWKYSGKDATRQFLVSSSFEKLDVWNNRETMPTNYDIYKKITNENYISHKKGTACYRDNRGNGYDPPYGTPGFFEIKVRLNYQRHSSDRGRYGSTSSRESDKIYLNASSESFSPPPNGWRITKDEKTEIRFSKGEKEVILKDWSDDSDWVLTEGYIGASSHYYIRGNDLKSLDVSMKLAYDFMKYN